ncbi:MAG: (2Fe-2S) ferredoxin domain-containing protein, partial [Elusimicrobiaceae bacterium]|nr:(2Fe-2S) ferredoxin domain-containing protein [Elusimicrobiaceae bacterium]
MAAIDKAYKDGLNCLPAGIKDAFLKRLSAADIEEVFRERKPSVPMILVGAGTCGLATGAGRTLEAVRKYLADRKIAAEVVEVGCVGFCAMEPLVDVWLPGRNRIAFHKITADRVPALLDAVFSGGVTPEMTLGQYHGEDQGWENIPYLNDHPFFKKQVKNVLKNCGVISPVNIS